MHLIINAGVTLVIKRNYCQPVLRNLSSFQSCELLHLQKVRDRSGKNDLDMTSPNTCLLIGAFSSTRAYKKYRDFRMENKLRGDLNQSHCKF